MFLSKPGARGPLVALQDAARMSYERVRESNNAEVAARKKRRIPLDDQTDPHVVRGLLHAAGLALEACDTGKLRDALNDALQATAEPAAELPLYEIRPELDGIFVRARALSEERRAELVGDVLDVLKEKPVNASARARLAHGVDFKRAQAALVKAAIVEVQGLKDINDEGAAFDVEVRADGDAELSDDLVARLRELPIFSDLYCYARDFQALDPFTQRRCGLPAPSTSEQGEASTAPPAAAVSAASTAATAAPPSRGSSASDTRPIAAHDGTPSITPPSSTALTASTGSPTDAPASGGCAS